MSKAELFHAPSECPVCGEEMITTRKGCLHCGSELAGEFKQCEFCALNTAELDLLKVFLSSRGNTREVAKHLDVSYPTARLRLMELLKKIGLTEEEIEFDSGEELSENSETRSQILAKVAAGEISVEQAATLLS